MFGIDDVAGAMIGSSVVGGALGFLGSRQQNISAARNAREQMDFEERMSNTSYQRAVSDMSAAGLNPMLAYSKGGASTPSGTAAPVVNEASSAAGAADVMQRVAEYKKAMAETNNTNMQTALVQATIPKLAADARAAMANAWVTEQTINAAIAQKQNESDKSGADRHLAYFAVDKAHMEAPFYGENAVADWRVKQASAAQAEQDLSQSAAMFNPLLSTAKSEAILREFQIPGARNRAASENTWFGENVRPYLEDAGKVVSTAGDIQPWTPIGKAGRIGGAVVKPWRKP